MRNMAQLIAGLLAIVSLHYTAADGAPAATTVAEVPAVSSVGPRIVNGPYLQNPAEDGVTVVWQTDAKCVSHVEYGTGEDLGLTAFHSQHGLIDADTTLQRIRISGLRPGTTYRYRAVSKAILKFDPYKVTYGETVKSDFHKFTTLDREKTEFSFLVLNDRHEKIGPLETALAAVDWDAVDLVFLNGDMLNHVETEPQVFQSLIDPCVRSFATRIPFVFIRGNHETRGRFARLLTDYFCTEAGTYYHAFTHGHVRFLVMDSGEDKPDSNEEYSGLVDFDHYREIQTRWLEEQIKSKAFRKARLRVVLFHIPPFGGNDWYGEQELRRQWVPLLNAGRVDLLVCGHTHYYARLSPEKGKHDFPILIGDTESVIRFDVSRRQLKACVTKDDGTVTDEFVLSPKARFGGRFFGFLGR